MLKVDFCKGETSSDLNRSFTKMGVRGMIEGKDYPCVYKLFPFVATSNDRATGLSQNASMTFVHMKYSDLE